MAYNVLHGHALQNEGAPWTAPSCTEWPCDKHPGVVRVGQRGGIAANGVGGHGHGLCECGAQSKHVLSGAARRRWHVAHKDDERAKA